MWKAIFTSIPTSIIKPIQPFLRELRSPAEEGPGKALRWIKSLSYEPPSPLQECAIFAPDLNQYRPYLHSAAT
ncbi:hypothetical protein [Candidatus Villigracilis affinis]|uniref:hypothetical protein n=1 Tax=Candidatus Villigracilis affinis TaxID=3140682 RepID=UPI002A20E901|nr:hypothetical protein [Anaerolineales bacterium]